MTSQSPRPTRILRPREWADPPRAARRETVVARPPNDETEQPPVVLVPGLGHGAWMYTEHWLDHIAGRGFHTTAMSQRGQGRSERVGDADLRTYVHDVTQVASALPRQVVLVGHGVGALVVAMAMARYPVRAGVLVAPVFGGLPLIRSGPLSAVSAAVTGATRPRHRQLFGGELPSATAREYTQAIASAPRTVCRQLLRSWQPERPVGDPPVLVVGSPDDRMVAQGALNQVAARYGGAPLLFPGMGHELPLDARWREPADAICDWLLSLD